LCCAGPDNSGDADFLYAYALQLQEELNREATLQEVFSSGGREGGVVVLSSDSDDEGVVPLCILCNLRYANRSSRQFSR